MQFYWMETRSFKKKRHYLWVSELINMSVRFVNKFRQTQNWIKWFRENIWFQRYWCLFASLNNNYNKSCRKSESPIGLEWHTVAKLWNNFPLWVNKFLIINTIYCTKCCWLWQKCFQVIIKENIIRKYWWTSA